MSLGGLTRYLVQQLFGTPRMLVVGTHAPDFEAADQDGRLRTLREFRGKKVVLWFYPKAETPGCTREGCAFRDTSAAYAEKNAQIIGVSLDSVEDNARFGEKHRFRFPLLADRDRAIAMAYGACENPRDELARRIAYLIGEDGRILQAHARVDAATYPHEQLANL